MSVIQVDTPARATDGAVSALLHNLVAYLRRNLSVEEVRTVALYGGEFGHAEVPQTEFAAPALLVSALAMSLKAAKLNVFVVTKNATREGRALECVQLTERVLGLIEAWRPKCPPQLDDAANTALNMPGPSACIGRIDLPSVMAQNLFERNVDKYKLAIWALSWTHAVCPMPAHTYNPAALPDFTAINARSAMQTSVPKPAPASDPVAVQACFKASP